jgi:RHS repeat-associated protein
MGIQYGNGLTMNYTYDPTSRISLAQLNNTSTHTTFLRLAYTYNSTGTVASVIGQVNQAKVNEQYRYDPLWRLVYSNITSQGVNALISYSLDNVGNRLSQTANGTTTNYSYNSANNELTSAGTTSYSYDANGNLLSRTMGSARWTYAWDVANHLLKVGNGTTQGRYAYDGNGRMLESIEASQNTYFAYMGTATLWKNGTDYIYAGTQLVAFTSDNLGYRTPRYYHTDALGSVRLMTKDDATVWYTNGYQPYGQDNGNPNCPSCPTSPPIKFTGKPYSPGTGLYYYYHRWYDPATGRFVSVDPRPGSLSSPQSLNPYIYVTDSPVNNIDPAGEWGFDSLVSAVSNVFKPIANTVSSIGSAALAVTTSAVNNVASVAASVTNTLVATTISTTTTLTNVAKAGLVKAADTLASAGAGRS